MSAVEAEWAPPLPPSSSKPGHLLLLPPDIPEPGDPPAKPPPALPPPPVSAATQPVGSDDVRIKKTMADERTRCEILLKNYRDLHGEYAGLLRGELARRQGELKRLTLDQQSHHESPELLLRLRGELLARTRELEALRLQQVTMTTPRGLELLLRARLLLSQDVMGEGGPGAVREHFDRLEEKIERHRSEYKELLYEHILLACENISLKSRCCYDDDEGLAIQEDECASSDPPKDSRRRAPSRLKKGLEAEVSELRVQNARLADQLREAAREVGGSLTRQAYDDCVKKKHDALKSEAGASSRSVESKVEVGIRECDALRPRGPRCDDATVLRERREQQQEAALTERDMELIRRAPATREQEAYKAWLENRLADTEQEMDELERRNRTLGARLGTLSRSQGALVETNGRLRDMLDGVCEELRATRAEADRSLQQQHEAAAAAAAGEEEKHGLPPPRRHAAEMQDKYSKAKERLWRNNRKVAELESMEADAAAAEECPSLSEERLIRQLRELRHAM